MKLVREHINEAFSEESDPIRDMGIGLYSKHNFDSGQEALDFVWEVLPYLYGGKFPEDIINVPGSGFFGIGYEGHYGEIINNYCRKYVFVKGKNIISEDTDMKMWNFNNAIHNALIRAGYPLSDEAIEDKRYETGEYRDIKRLKIKNSVKESYTGFTEDTDPIQDMGIGLEAKMKKKLKDLDVADFILFLDDIPEIRNKYRDEDANYDDIYYDDVPWSVFYNLGIKEYMLKKIEKNTAEYDGFIDWDEKTVTLGGGI